MAKRKIYQRRMNKIVRKINKSIQNDWLWNGRFYIKQYAAWFFPFEDNSGATFEAIYIIHDRKTGRKESAVFDNYNIDWKLSSWANKCITEVWKVWEENPNPIEQAKSEGRNLPAYP